MLYVALLLLSIHWAVVIYINSSFLAQFVSTTTISLLYIAGSLASLVCFFYMPAFLQSIGNFRLTILFTLLEISAVVGMALAMSPFTASVYFLLHFILVPLLLFNLDVFIEDHVGSHEGNTGSIRGLYLSLLSLATAIGPLITGSLVATNHNSFSLPYLVSALTLLPFMTIIIVYFRKFVDPTYTLLSLKSMGEVFKENFDTRNIVVISFYLQLFFIWMVMYTPLYLAHVVGFSWHEIGLIMFVGLSAYVIFEYPIGIIADKYTGEKEMMILGFALLFLATFWFAFLSNASIGLWMFAMFLSRVGASFVEATAESYFFKHAGGKDVDRISLFRMTRPLSSVIGAVVGSVALLYLEFNFVFILFAFCMLPGLYYTLRLQDTK